METLEHPFPVQPGIVAWANLKSKKGKNIICKNYLIKFEMKTFIEIDSNRRIYNKNGSEVQWKRRAVLLASA